MKHDFFESTFFPSTIIEWNKLDWKIKGFESIEAFKRIILSFITPSPNSAFNCHKPKGINLLSRLKLGLSDLGQYKFNTVFKIISSSALVVEKVRFKLFSLSASIFQLFGRMIGPPEYYKKY